MSKTLQKIKNDSLAARKARNKFLAKILTTLLGDIISVGKNDGNRDTTEEETLVVIDTFKKKAEETANYMADTGADSKEMEDYIEEISIYASYLPQQMTEDKLTALIKDIVSHDSEINIGKVMGYLSKNHKGLYSGKMANKIAKNLIP